MRFRHQLASVLALAAALWLPPASAGTFAISPIRVDFADGATTASLTVRNEDDAPALIQVESMLWSQADGEDKLDPTRDVLVTPAVFTLPPKGSQLLRVALRKPADAVREATYRVIVQEVPPEASPDFTGLRVALRLSIPVFVPPAAPAKPDLVWSATRNDSGAIVLRADNQGQAHARVLGLTLTPQSGRGAALQDSVASYVLPGQYRTWTLNNNDKIRDDGSAAAAAYRLKASTESGEVVTELSVGH